MEDIRMTEFEKEMYTTYQIDKLPTETQKEILRMKRFYVGHENGSLELCEEYLKGDVMALFNVNIEFHHSYLSFIAGRLRKVEYLKTGDYVRGIQSL